jgi:hypothetical protein
MSVETRWCALCASEYVAGVAECLDCLVPLVAVRPASVDDVGSPDEAQIAYDLDELDTGARLELDQRLTQAGVVHAWDGASLVIREADEEVVDTMVDDAGDAAGLDDDEDQVAFELSDWSDDQRAQLSELLGQAQIPFAYDDEGDLIVREVDDERVEAIIDAVEYPDQLPVDDGAPPDPRGVDTDTHADANVAADEDQEGDDDQDGDEAQDGDDGLVDDLAATDALSELFVASDRLMHDPEDHEGVLSLVDAARMAESLAVPYGFAPAIWRDLVAQAVALRQLLEGEAGDDEVMEQARNLRTLLRQWV